MPEFVRMTDPAKPPRTPWRSFPDVLIHASETAVKQHPAYRAAKSGSADAALALVRETVSEEQNFRLAQLFAGHAPTLVSAHAFEREGINAIPEVFADGPVQPGREYVLVDDFVGMGGTLANMKGYVESRGGRVLAAVALTGKPHSAKLALTQERLDELRNRHGTELENWWLARFAHAFDALTESEARYLARTADADTVRSRIAAAE